MRVRLDVAYDGTDFHGWAVQPSLRTVQGELEQSLAQVLRLEAVTVTCAGRTDTGVHARGQVVHFDVDEDALLAVRGRTAVTAPEALLRRLNGVTGTDVRVLRAVEAPAGFDARFSAVWRRYAYRIADISEALDPLHRRHVLSWPRRLDLASMNEAASHLLGEHDFAAFCRRRQGATTIRTLLELSWERDARGAAVGTVRADAFCHNMVRALVGCLMVVGEGRRDAGWVKDVLLAGVRDPAVRVVRPHGLTLEEVCYPPSEELAARATAARRMRELS